MADESQILSRVQTLVRFTKHLQWRNTELRLEQFQLNAELEQARREAEMWRAAAVTWERETINWQQIATAAIAKSEQAERLLLAKQLIDVETNSYKKD